MKKIVIIEKDCDNWKIGSNINEGAVFKLKKKISHTLKVQEALKALKAPKALKGTKKLRQKHKTQISE